MLGEKTVKFRVNRSISSFRYKGVRYLPGDIVKLPESFKRKNFLDVVTTTTTKRSSKSQGITTTTVPPTKRVFPDAKARGEPLPKVDITPAKSEKPKPRRRRR